MKLAGGAAGSVDRTAAGVAGLAGPAAPRSARCPSVLAGASRAATGTRRSVWEAALGAAASVGAIPCQPPLRASAIIRSAAEDPPRSKGANSSEDRAVATGGVLITAGGGDLGTAAAYVGTRDCGSACDGTTASQLSVEVRARATGAEVGGAALGANPGEELGLSREPREKRPPFFLLGSVATVGGGLGALSLRRENMC
jgi:hypothetical protein